MRGTSTLICSREFWSGPGTRSAPTPIAQPNEMASSMSRVKNIGPASELSFSAFDGSSAKGEQILRSLTDLIETQLAGTLLPSERVLAERFGVARMTIRQSIDELEKRGLARREPRLGTFVQEPRLIHSDIFRSFSEDMRLRGMVPGTSRLFADVRIAGPELAPRLGIGKTDRVHYLERVRTADGEPMAIERTNLPFDLFPQLDAQLEEGASLYQVLGEQYGVRLETAEQHIRIDRLSHGDAIEMKCLEADPAFLIERSSRDAMGRVIEFGRSLYRSDRYEILMQVHRPD